MNYTGIIETTVGMPRLTIEHFPAINAEDAIKYGERVAGDFAGVRWFLALAIWARPDAAPLSESKLLARIRLGAPQTIIERGAP